MAALRADVVERGDGLHCDSGVKNPWKWTWLEKKMYDVPLSEVIRKLDGKGLAYCIICRKEINYSNRGAIALQDHVSSGKHQSAVKARRTNTSLPGTFVI